MSPKETLIRRLACDLAAAPYNELAARQAELRNLLPRLLDADFSLSSGGFSAREQDLAYLLGFDVAPSGGA